MPFMRRRPLLRAAAVGGVAYMGAKAGTNGPCRPRRGPAAGYRPRRRRPPRPAPAAPAGDDTISRLTQLAVAPQLRGADRRGVRRRQGAGAGLIQPASSGSRSAGLDRADRSAQRPVALARSNDRSISAHAASTPSKPPTLVSLSGSRSL